VTGPEDMHTAARKIKALGPQYVLIKGGHLEGTPMDLLYDGKTFTQFSNQRYDTPHTHGTGCSFASAIAAWLARGCSVPEAVGRAKHFITCAIAEGFALGGGHGPVHHFHGLYRLAGWPVPT
jgi:hydroxymethylpyrimidine/phosphomethylpyrimidine kinase